MADPQSDDKPAPSALDAEREKLRKAGYNETEISQILVARALGSPDSSASSPAAQGVMSGAVSSVVAIGSYARGTVFTIRNDLATIFDATALASARVAATAMLVFKVAVISVLAFAAWQEWQQHIISATAIAESQARKIKAEECTARVESAAKNMRLSDVEKGIYSNEELARDCDPNYAHRKALEAACAAKYKAIFVPIEVAVTLKAFGQFTDKLGEVISDYKSECTFTQADEDYGKRKLLAVRIIPSATTAAPAENKVASAQRSPTTIVDETETKNDLANYVTDSVHDIQQAHEAGNYVVSLKLAQAFAAKVEAAETKKTGKAGKLTSLALTTVSWEALFAREYDMAYGASTRSLELDPNNLESATNQAHALMLSGHVAVFSYIQHLGKLVNNKKWEDVIIDDFAKLRRAGISDPAMEEVEGLMRHS